MISETCKMFKKQTNRVQRNDTCFEPTSEHW